MDFKLITDSLEGWFAFIKVNYKDLFRKFFVVNLYVFFTAILGLLAIGAGTVGLGYLSATSNIVIIIGAFLLFLFFVLSATLFSLALYRITDQAHKENKKVDIIGLATQKAPAFILYLIASAAIIILFTLPFSVLGYALDSIFNITSFVIFVSEFGLILCAILIGLFLHFALYELVILDLGVFESIKTSYSLVRKKLLETIVFLLILAALESLVSLPFMLAFYLMIIGYGVIAGVSGLALLSIIPSISTIVLIVIGAIGLILFILLLLFQVTFQHLVKYPLTYQFWRNLRNEPIIDKPALTQEQKVALAKRVKSVVKKKTSK